MRTLSLLFDAGSSRYVVAAPSVLEVASPDASGDTLHGHHTLIDLSAWLGGADEQRPGTAVLLETTPTRAVRVKAVRGVRDTTDAPFIQLPRRISALLSPHIHGLRLLGNELFCELNVDGLHEPLTAASSFVSPQPLTQFGGKVLLFEVGDATLGVPLASMAQVVMRGPSFCCLPESSGVLGVLHHQQQAWPIHALGSHDGAFLVLAEFDGEGVGFAATRALGLVDAAKVGNATVLDLRRMFS